VQNWVNETIIVRITKRQDPVFPDLNY